MTIFNSIKWATAGNLAFALAQWITLITIAKTTSAEELGLYALATAIVAPIFAFGSMNLRSIAATDAVEAFSEKEYIFARSITLILATATAISIGLLTKLNFHFITVLVIVSSIRVFESYSDMVFGFRQREDRMDQIGVSLLVRALLTSMLVIIAGYFCRSVGFIVASVLVASVTTYFLCDFQFYYTKSHNRPLNAMNAFSLLKLALPLGVVVGLNLFVLQVPRYWIAQEDGAASLGYFAGLVYFISVGGILVNAVGQAALAKLSRHFTLNRFHFAKLALRLIVFGLLVGMISILGGYFFGREILTLVYTPEFGKYEIEFVLILVAGTILYVSVLLGVALTAAKEYSGQMISSLIGAVGALAAAATISAPSVLAAAAWILIVAFVLKLLAQFLVLIRAILGEVRNDEKS